MCISSSKFFGLSCCSRRHCVQPIPLLLFDHLQTGKSLFTQKSCWRSHKAVSQSLEHAPKYFPASVNNCSRDAPPCRPYPPSACKTHTHVPTHPHPQWDVLPLCCGDNTHPKFSKSLLMQISPNTHSTQRSFSHMFSRQEQWRVCTGKQGTMAATLPAVSKLCLRWVVTLWWEQCSLLAQPLCGRQILRASAFLLLFLLSLSLPPHTGCIPLQQKWPWPSKGPLGLGGDPPGRLESQPQETRLLTWRLAWGSREWRQHLLCRGECALRLTMRLDEHTHSHLTVSPSPPLLLLLCLSGTHAHPTMWLLCSLHCSFGTSC